MSRVINPPFPTEDEDEALEGAANYLALGVIPEDIQVEEIK